MEQKYLKNKETSPILNSNTNKETLSFLKINA